MNIKAINQNGTIEIYDSCVKKVIGDAVAECYGVEGPSDNRLSTRFLSAMPFGSNFQRKTQDKSGAIYVRSTSRGICIDIHIVVTYGLNITSIVKSVVNRVREAVDENIGLDIEKLNVFVDGMTRALM